MSSQSRPPEVGCQASEYGVQCTALGRVVGFGIRLCTEHERKMLRWLKKRDRDRQCLQVAFDAAGERPPQQSVYPGWGETSGGLPTLGKDR